MTDQPYDVRVGGRHARHGADHEEPDQGVGDELRVGVLGEVAHAYGCREPGVQAALPSAVQQLCDWLWHGPPAARVDEVATEEVDPRTLAAKPDRFSTR